MAVQSYCRIRVRISFFKEQGLRVEKDTNGIWWYDGNLYDSEKDRGPHFVFHARKGWKSLFSGDPEKSGWIGLYVGTSRLEKEADKNRLYDEWRALLMAHRDKLQDYTLPPDPAYEDYNLVWYQLHDEVNMDTLAEPDELRSRVQRAARSFTLAILPLLRTKA
jgi:hypothetical protein